MIISLNTQTLTNSPQVSLFWLNIFLYILSGNNTTNQIKTNKPRPLDPLLFPSPVFWPLFPKGPADNTWIT